MNRYGFPLWAILLICMVPATWAENDRIIMRTGEEIKGRLLSETPLGWQIVTCNGLVSIHPTVIQRLHISDPVRASRYYGLPSPDSPDMVDVVLLPTEAFGRDLVEGLRAAQNSIHILAYNINGWSSSPISDVFQTLREKAEAGVEVVVILEFGSSTDKRLAAMVMNFAEQLNSSGIQVRYLQEYMIQHKKIVLVDDKLVWVGSANLTAAAMASNDEMSARTSAPQIVSAAKADYERLFHRSKPAKN